MINFSQLINHHDNRDSILHTGATPHEKKNFDEEPKRSLRIEAENDQAARYFKALREIEFLMVRI
jgi:hypothetical protein